MKQWSVAIVAVVVLALLSWLGIYRVDGTQPTPGITVAVVGFWLIVVGVVVRLLKRERGDPRR